MKDKADNLCVLTAAPVMPLPANPVPAMAYVPFQLFDKTLPPERALMAGTLFPELDKPFFGKAGDRC